MSIMMETENVPPVGSNTVFLMLFFFQEQLWLLLQVLSLLPLGRFISLGFHSSVWPREFPQRLEGCTIFYSYSHQILMKPKLPPEKIKNIMGNKTVQSNV